MGEVYLAQHTLIARQAAIKLLLPQVSTDPETVGRFFTEARATSFIQHEGIVEILDCGTLDGRAYIVMEYLEGESLGARLARERSFIQDLGTLAFIGASVARALAAAHARGIVHRDLKPDNIYLAKSVDGHGPVRVKILDFGIAKLTGSDKEVGASHTRAGLLMGTPLYMSPEQCRGLPTVDSRTDLYALGCILYEMIAGQPPFVSDNSGDLLIAHATLIPPPLSQIEPRVPPPLEELVARLLAKEPAERPASMEEVARALENLNQTHRPTNTVVVQSPDQAPIGEVSPQTGRTSAVGGTAILEASSAKSPQVKGARQTRGSGKPAAGDAAAPPPASSKRALVVLGVVVVTLVLGIAGWVLLKGDGSKLQIVRADGGNKPRSTAPPEGKTTAPAPAGMLAIAGRSFTMGSTPAEVQAAFAFCKSAVASCRQDVFEREQPQRTITVDTFFLDATEVTNVAFADWLSSSGASVHDQRMVRDTGGRLLADLHPLHGGVEMAEGKFRSRAGRGDLPAVQVTWWGAKAFCAAQGKRLPSEAEWECAARAKESAGDLLHFPWGGSKPECGAVTFGGGAKGVCPAISGPRPVGTSIGDVTVDGVHDLGGNVGEWVADAFVAPYPSCAEDACKNPVVSSEDADLRVIRGGDWLQAADASRSTGRSRRSPDKAEINVGFRCAK